MRMELNKGNAMNSNVCGGNQKCTNTNGRISGGTAVQYERFKVTTLTNCMSWQDNAVAQKVDLILGYINSMTKDVIIPLY